MPAGIPSAPKADPTSEQFKGADDLDNLVMNANVFAAPEGTKEGDRRNPQAPTLSNQKREFNAPLSCENRLYNLSDDLLRLKKPTQKELSDLKLEAVELRNNYQTNERKDVDIIVRLLLSIENCISEGKAGDLKKAAAELKAIQVLGELEVIFKDPSTIGSDLGKAATVHGYCSEIAALSNYLPQDLKEKADAFASWVGTTYTGYSKKWDEWYVQNKKSRKMDLAKFNKKGADAEAKGAFNVLYSSLKAEIISSTDMPAFELQRRMDRICASAEATDRELKRAVNQFDFGDHVLNASWLDLLKTSALLNLGIDVGKIGNEKLRNVWRAVSECTNDYNSFKQSYLELKTALQSGDQPKISKSLGKLSESYIALSYSQAHLGILAEDYDLKGFEYMMPALSKAMDVMMAVSLATGVGAIATLGRAGLKAALLETGNYMLEQGMKNSLKITFAFFIPEVASEIVSSNNLAEAEQLAQKNQLRGMLALSSVLQNSRSSRQGAQNADGMDQLISDINVATRDLEAKLKSDPGYKLDPEEIAKLFLVSYGQMLLFEAGFGMLRGAKVISAKRKQAKVELQKTRIEEAFAKEAEILANKAGNFHSPQEKAENFAKAGEAYERAGNSFAEDAGFCYYNASEFCPPGEKFNYLVKAGECYLRDTQSPKSSYTAADIFKQAARITKDPVTKVELWKRVGDIFSAKGDYAPAIDAYNNAFGFASEARLYGEIVICSEKEARCQLAKGDLNGAANTYGLLARSADFENNTADSFKYHAKSGEIYRECKNIQAVADHFANAAKNAPTPDAKAKYSEIAAENYFALEQFQKAGEFYWETAKATASQEKIVECCSKAEKAYLRLSGDDYTAGIESIGVMYENALGRISDPALKSEYLRKAVEYRSRAAGSYIDRKNYSNASMTYKRISEFIPDKAQSEVYLLLSKYCADLDAQRGNATISEPAPNLQAHEIFKKAVLSKNQAVLKTIAPTISFGEILKIEDGALRAIAVESKTSMRLSFGDLDMQRSLFDTYAAELQKQGVKPSYAKLCSKILANIYTTTKDHAYLDKIISISKKTPIDDLPRIIASISEADLRAGEINAMKLLVRQGLDVKLFKFFANKLMDTGYLTKSASKFLGTEENRAFLKELIAKYPTQVNTSLDTILKIPDFDIRKEKQVLFSALDELGCATPVLFQRYRLADKAGRADLVKKMSMLKSEFFKNKPIKDILPESDMGILDEVIYNAYLPKNISFERMRELLRSLDDRCSDIEGYKFPEDGYSLSFKNKSYQLREGEKADLASFSHVKSLFEPLYPSSPESKIALNEALLRVAKAGPDFSDAQVKSILSLLSKEWLSQNVRQGYNINDSRSMYRFLSASKELLTIHAKDVFGKKLAEYFEAEPQVYKSVMKILSNEANQKVMEQQLGMKGQINWQEALSSPESTSSILSAVVSKKVCAPELKAINRELKKFQESKEEGETVADEYTGYVSKNAASFFAKAAAGLCTAEDISFYMENSNYFHINIVKNGSQVTGNIQAYVIELNGKNALLLRGFNPTEGMLAEINPSSFCEETLRVARQFAADNNLAGIYITAQGGWHALSNRSDVADYLGKYTTSSNKVPFEMQISSSASVESIHKIPD